MVVSMHETRRRQERDKTQVRQLTGIFQTIHGLIDAEDDEALAGAGGADEGEGEERETGKDCRGVGVYVDSDELMNRRWERGRVTVRGGEERMESTSLSLLGCSRWG